MKFDMYVDSCGICADGAAGVAILVEDRVVFLGALEIPLYDYLYDVELQGVQWTFDIAAQFVADHEVTIYNDRLYMDISKMRSSVPWGVKVVDSSFLLTNEQERVLRVEWASKRRLFKSVHSREQLLERIYLNPHSAGIWLTDKLGRDFYCGRIENKSTEISVHMAVNCINSKLGVLEYCPSLSDIIHELWNVRYQDEAWKAPDHSYMEEWFCSVNCP